MKRTKPPINEKNPRKTTPKKILEKTKEDTTPTEDYFQEKDKIEISYTLEQLKEILPHEHITVVNEYIRNGWRKAAAWMSVYQVHNYGSAAATASKFFKDPKIKQLVSLMRDNIEEICNISVQRQVDFYAKIAYRNIGVIYDNWVDLKHWEELLENNPEILEIIEGIKTRTIRKVADGELIEIQQVEIKFPSRIQAAAKIDELLGYNKPIKIDANNVLNLGQGNVSDIRKAFKLDKK